MNPTTHAIFWSALISGGALAALTFLCWLAFTAWPALLRLLRQAQGHYRLLKPLRRRARSHLALHKALWPGKRS